MEQNPVQQPPIFQPTASRSSSKLFVLLGVLVLLGLIGLGSFVLGIKVAQPAVEPEPIATAPVQTSPVPTTDPTADWKTYINSKIGIEFKYPQEYAVLKENASSVQVGTEEKSLLVFSVGHVKAYSTFPYCDNTRSSESMPVKPPCLEQGVIGGPNNDPEENSLKNAESELFVVTDVGNLHYDVLQINKPTKMEVRFSEEEVSIEKVIQILSTFKFTSASTAGGDQASAGGTQAQTTNTSTWKTYTNNQYYFAFTYPSSWIVNFNKTEGHLYDPATSYKGGNGGGVTLYKRHLWFLIAPLTQTASSYVDDIEKSYVGFTSPAGQPGFSRKTMTINGKTIPIYYDPQGEGTYGWYVVFSNGKNIFNFGPTENDPTQDSEYSKIISSFRFE